MVPGEIGNIPEHREVTGTPGEVYGPYWALVERMGKEQGRGRPPQAQSELGGGPAPLSFPPPSSSVALPLQTRKGGVLLPVGVGLPPWAHLLPLAGPLLPSFIYGGEGHPIDTTIDLLDLFVVCGAPLHHSPPR